MLPGTRTVRPELLKSGPLMQGSCMELAEEYKEFLSNSKTERECVDYFVNEAEQKGYVELNDKIAYLSGNISVGGATKFLEINTVKEVFEQGYEFHMPKI